MSGSRYKNSSEGKTCVPVVLSIAGLDPSGGAGVLADVKTISSTGLFAAGVVTAITAQNTIAVSKICQVEPQMVAAQIDAVFEDLTPEAVKIGMLPNADLTSVVAERLRHF